MTVAHPGCGEPVEIHGGAVLDPDGGEHLCSDYVAWHLPPERRHPDDIPSRFDWVPARPAVEIHRLRRAA